METSELSRKSKPLLSTPCEWDHSPTAQFSDTSFNTFRVYFQKLGSSMCFEQASGISQEGEVRLGLCGPGRGGNGSFGM